MCQGLWSYANSGFWAAGEACAAATGMSFADAMRERILEPLGLEHDVATRSRRAPPRATSRRARRVTVPPGRPDYPVARRPVRRPLVDGRRSAALCASSVRRSGPVRRSSYESLQEPQAEALGAEYCLGCWRRELEGGRIAFDHEGSVAGFQSLLLIVPEERVALAVLTNSWRGSGAIRRVVRELGLVPTRDEIGVSAAAPIRPTCALRARRARGRGRATRQLACVRGGDRPDHGCQDRAPSVSGRAARRRRLRLRRRPAHEPPRSTSRGRTSPGSAGSRSPARTPELRQPGRTAARDLLDVVADLRRRAPRPSRSAAARGRQLQISTTSRWS